MKNLLLSSLRNEKESDMICVLVIEGAGLLPELIVVQQPSMTEKADYIEWAYDDHLINKNNPKISIRECKKINKKYLGTLSEFL